MALEIIEKPATEPDMGMFNLPPEFDREKYAAKWVKKGHEVEAARQRQTLIGAGNVSADGWQVYKPAKGGLHTANTQKGEYVLMFRDKAVQEQVNAVYGNVGKQRMMAEKSKAAASRGETGATGMLSDEQLRAAGYRDDLARSEQEGEVVLNPVEIGPRITPPVLDLTQ